MRKPKNQTELVLQYLSSNAHINKFRAQGELHVNDLRKVVSNIRALGYKITKSQDKNYNGQAYTNYSLTAEGQTKAVKYFGGNDVK